jgi:hypothetical protein
MKYDLFNYKDLPEDLILKKKRIKFYGPENENHSRWLFISPDGKFFYKSWNSDYVRKNNLPNALDAEFYDEKLIPAFRALILDENEVCRGYIMEAMKIGSVPPDDEFLKHIKEKTRKSKYFFYDFWRASIMDYKGKPCLIDLESVYPLCEYDFRKQQNKDVYDQKDHLIKNPPYRNYVEELFKDIC